MSYLKPVLRWAGSKQRLLPTLAAKMPAEFNRYFEPFAGSAALFFAVRPERATLSDINGELVNFYSLLRREPEYVYRRMISMPRTQSAYMDAREAFEASEDRWERAILFWYLNRHCFNGLYRTSRAGKFNVPFGSKLPPLPEWEQVRKCAARLRRASVKSADFESVISSAESGDFSHVSNGSMYSMIPSALSCSYPSPQTRPTARSASPVQPEKYELTGHRCSFGGSDADGGENSASE